LRRNRIYLIGEARRREEGIRYAACSHSARVEKVGHPGETMKKRRYPIQICSLGLMISAVFCNSGLAQILFFDNFQPFSFGTILTSTSYTPLFGPATASAVTSIQSGSPTITVSNLMGNYINWAYFNNSVPANQNQYKGILSSVQTNLPLLLTWELWIKGTNTGPGMFQLSIPASNSITNYHPLLAFADTGSILAQTNGTNAQFPIGYWRSVAGTVMTNSLLLDYPDGTFSYSLNGQTLATLPLGPSFTNVVGAFYFSASEGTAGSLGNRFALTGVGVQAFVPTNTFIYILTNNTITITGYTGTNAAVIIPDTINGLAVTSIGNYAFEGRIDVTSVTIPDNVTSIGSYAFLGTGLKSITIGNGVTNIGINAFAFCSSLTNVTVSSSVASIGGTAFYLDNALTGVYFLGNAPSADNTLFGGASGKVFYVPGTTGWSNAYGGLAAAPRYLPHPVILGNGQGLGIKTNGFGFTVSWATNLSIIVEASTNLANLFWTPLATNTLSNGFFYFREPGWTNFSSRFYRLAHTNMFSSFAVNSTNGVTPFAVQFSPSNVDCLGNPIIGWHWNFGDGATSSAQYPLHTYTNAGLFTPSLVVTNIYASSMPGYGPQIATFSFLATTNNGSIAITGFTGTLVSNLAIPASLNGLPVTSIGPRAFYFCLGLTDVTIPAGVGSIGDYAFNSCGSLAGVVLGSGITNVGNFAFTFDSSLSGLVLPNGVTFIGSNAFEYCTGLSSITLPDTVGSLGPFAFGSCGGLTNVALGNSVTNIGNAAFTYCTNLTDITLSQSVATLGISSFYACSHLASAAIDCGNVGDLAFAYCDSLSNVVFGGNVRTIRNSAFADCNSLASVNLPGQLAGIGVNAFEACTNLAILAIAGGDVGDYAFSACGSLDNVAMGSGVQNVGTGAFANCGNLSSVILPGGIANINGNAFGSDASLARIYFQGNAPIVDPTAFSGTPGTVYYFPGATGWANFFAGLPVLLWNPVIQTQDSSFGVRANQFGFNISGTANIPIAIEATTNLVDWTPLLNCTLTNGSLHFSDPAWNSFPARFYRLNPE
jgi:hypothetical protein